jgi:hypothetical protein
MNIGKNMILTSNYWNEAKSFKLVPATEDCPYTEALYDINTGLLAVISKIKKQVFHNVPKLDDNGDVMYMKLGKRENGRPYKEERRTLETFHEYYIIEEKEIIDFIKAFTINEDSYDYMQYIEIARKKDNPDILVPETPALVDATGAEIK